MAKYLLGEWEDNGYHDSDFCAAIWDSETKSAEKVLVGSTRFAGGFEYPDTEELTEEVLEEARVWLENHIFDQLRAAEHRDIMEPDDAYAGLRIQLLEDHRAKPKSCESCKKCGGSGAWVNPHRDDDIRDCFTCQGTGTTRPRVVRGTKIGTFDAGSRGKVLSCTAYGAFYRNGYNRRSRENRTCVIRLDSGIIIGIPLKKLRLEKEPVSDEELRKKACELSFHYNFNKACGMRAWGKHFALEFANSKGE